MSRLPVTLALALSGLLLLAETAPAQQPFLPPNPGADCPAPPCADCAAHGKPQCICVPAVKKVTTIVYDCKTQEYCAAPGLLQLCGLLRHGCDICKCGPVRTKTILLKSVVTTECPTTRCVVPGQEVPVPLLPPDLGPGRRLPSLPINPPGEGFRKQR